MFWSKLSVLKLSVLLLLTLGFISITQAQVSKDQDSSFVKLEATDSYMKIPISDVELPLRKLEETKYTDLVTKLNSGKLEAIPLELIDKSFVHTKIHPVIGSLHYSFAHHRPVSISPDIVWLMIMQGLSKHFYFNSDSISTEIYTEKEKTILQIQRDNFVKGELTNNWAEVFPEFSDRIKESTNLNLHELFTPNFSTTTNNVSISYTITMMDALSEYYDYSVLTACGIPYVVLEGSPEDWKWIKDKLPELRKYDTDFWIDNLQPVIDEIYKSSTGNVNSEFWKSMYKWNGTSGGNRVTGWIIKFFPYIETNDNKKHVNTYLDYNIYLDDDDVEFNWIGLTGDDFPSGLSVCNFNWEYFGGNFNMQFCAGFIGISQDNNMVLRPEINWFVSEKPDTANMIENVEDPDAINWYKNSYTYGKETDLLNPYGNNMEGLFIKTCNNPDEYPIYDYYEGKSFEEGITEFKQNIFDSADYINEEGTVELTIVVSAEGQCYCLVSKGENEYINNAVCQCVFYSGTWKPATKNGKPVAVELKVEIHFTNKTQQE